MSCAVHGVDGAHPLFLLGAVLKIAYGCDEQRVEGQADCRGADGDGTALGQGE